MSSAPQGDHTPSHSSSYKQTKAYRYSFIPRTVIDWNNLPQNLINRGPACDVLYRKYGGLL